jgi:hypothetical protein
MFFFHRFQRLERLDFLGQPGGRGVRAVLFCQGGIQITFDFLMDFSWFPFKAST